MKKNRGINMATITGLGLFVLVGFFILVYTIVNLYFADKIFHQIKIENKNYGGYMIDEAIVDLQSRFSTSGQLDLQINEKSYTISKEDIDFRYLFEDVVKDAYIEGRSGNLLIDIVNRILNVSGSKNLQLPVSYDKNKLLLILSKLKIETTDRFLEPSFSLKDEKLVVVPGRTGLDFDIIAAENDIVSLLKYNELESPYLVNVYTTNPTIKDDEILSLSNQYESIVKKKVELLYSDQVWNPDSNLLGSFLKITKQIDGSVILEADQSSIFSYLEELSTKIDREPSGQILKIEEGKVIDFKPSLSGIRLLLKENTEELSSRLFSSEQSEIKYSLLVEETTAPSPDENNYGIKEKIGEGYSKFVGSIPSRIHNIELATSRVNGILISPGEVFSFNKTVGEVSRSTGYKASYVISGGRTVLGDGGGLCQVSTTVFRAALNSGLQIIARSPHSYRVGYYEQDSAPGIDATVYSPSVDLKFMNDTDHYILLVGQFNKEKSTLKYEIYGTKDNRTVEMTEPKILSRSGPPATIYEEDPTLPKGSRKQVEYAVSGASVQFTRKVTKDGVLLYDDVFKSNYRAWPAVIKVGTKE